MNRVCCYSRQTLGCIGCGKCCGAWAVPVSEEERRKIMALPLVGLPLPVEQCFERRRGAWYLKKKNRHCIFLDEEKKCRIHTQFGLEAKPLTCRLYPLDVWSWSDGSVSASLRCDCPAAAAGTGEELRRFKARILQFAEELKKRRPSPADAEYSPVIAPLVERLREIAAAYEKILTEESVPMKIRFFAAVCLIHFHMDKKNSDDILEAEEFGKDAFAFFKRSVPNLEHCLKELPMTLRRDVQVAFRCLLWGFLRADESVSLRSRIVSTVASLRFLLGGGSLKHSSARLNITGNRLFRAMRSCKPAPDAFQPYLRFLRGRLESLHFCGTPVHGLSFEEGMLYLAVSYPVIYALASVHALERGSCRFEEKDVIRSLVLLDHGFLRTRLYSLSSMKASLRKVTVEENFAALLGCCSEPE